MAAKASWQRNYVTVTLYTRETWTHYQQTMLTKPRSSTLVLEKSRRYFLVVYMSLSSGFDMPKSICGRKLSFDTVSFDAEFAALESSTYHKTEYKLYSSTDVSKM